MPHDRSSTPVSLARSASRRMRGYLKRLFDGQPAVQEQPKNKHLWSIGLYSGSSPFDLAPDGRFPNPVVTRDLVTDISAGFVADPFLVDASGAWHMYFEAYNRRTRNGEIAYATTTDLAEWTYGSVVLREPFHLSYPHVFTWQRTYYMIPETHQTRTIRLYRADDFPHKWSFVHTLMSGQRFADTTLIRRDGRWWLFTETSATMKHDTLRLFSSDDLFGTWTEHPASPLRMDDPHGARPGGSLVSLGASVVRYAQDCSPRYGLSINAFEITTLTTTQYAEVAAPANPLLGPSGMGWNEAGMHHVDAHELAPGQWIAAVDGWRHATAADIFGQH